MFTADELRGLLDQSVTETPGGLMGLAPDEPLVFQLVKSNRDKELFHFKVFYFDIHLADWAAKIQDDKVLWHEEKRP